MQPTTREWLFPWQSVESNEDIQNLLGVEPDLVWWFWLLKSEGGLLRLSILSALLPALVPVVKGCSCVDLAFALGCLIVLHSNPYCGRHFLGAPMFWRSRRRHRGWRFEAVTRKETSTDFFLLRLKKKKKRQMCLQGGFKWCVDPGRVQSSGLEQVL